MCCTPNSEIVDVANVEEVPDNVDIVAGVSVDIDVVADIDAVADVGVVVVVDMDVVVSDVVDVVNDAVFDVGFEQNSSLFLTFFLFVFFEGCGFSGVLATLFA